MAKESRAAGPRGERGSRVEFDVLGEGLWFTSPDLTLRATPEAHAALVAFGGPAIRAGVQVDPEFAAGVGVCA